MRAISSASQLGGKFIYIGLLFLVLLLLGGSAVVAVKIQARRTPEALTDSPPRNIFIDPPSVRLDRTYREGETVSARFSIVNPLDRPVIIRGITERCMEN